MKQEVSIRKAEYISEESAKRRSSILKMIYHLDVYDELITNNIHLLLVDIKPEIIPSIRKDKMVLHCKDPPRISID